MDALEINKPNLQLGDCFDILSIFKNDSIDLIVTDPPYGIDFRSGRQTVDRKKSVKGEGSVNVRDFYFESISEDHRLLTGWLTEAYRILKNDSAIYIFAHWSQWSNLYNAVEAVGFNVKNMIVLNKSNHGMGDLKGSYAPKHELLLYASKGRRNLIFPNGRTDDVWSVPVKFSGSHKFHPNEKPLSWIIPAILNSSIEKQVVLDPFMGSGSTGVAAISTGRKFIGIEKDPNYFTIAEDRIKNAITQFEDDIL